MNFYTVFIQHADLTLHILCQLSLSEVNPTQILLIFESMQHCRNDQDQEKLFKTFLLLLFSFFMPHIFLSLMLDALWSFKVTI